MPNLNSDSVSKHSGSSRRRGAGNLEHLLDAAELVFAERGYQGANIHEICARANVGIGTFYAHFEHKRHLLKRVMQERAVIFTDTLTVEDLADIKSFTAKMDRAVDDPRSVGLWRAWHEAVHEHADLREFHGKLRSEVLDDLAELIRNARRVAGSKPGLVDPHLVSWVVMTSLRTLVVQEREGAPDIATLVRFSHRLIFGEPSKA